MQFFLALCPISNMPIMVHKDSSFPFWVHVDDSEIAATAEYVLTKYIFASKAKYRFQHGQDEICVFLLPAWPNLFLYFSLELPSLIPMLLPPFHSFFPGCHCGLSHTDPLKTAFAKKSLTHYLMKNLLGYLKLKIYFVIINDPGTHTEDPCNPPRCVKNGFPFESGSSKLLLMLSQGFCHLPTSGLFISIWISI